MWPKISIVTPSYNQSRFLEQTIRSVLDQGYPNLEYIIIDGGSTDGSVEIIKRYERHLSYWNSSPDNGQADALNKGFALASGEVIGWINSDDLYCPTTLWQAGEWFNAHPEHDLFYGGLLLINGQDRIVDALWAGPPHLAYTYFVSLDIHQQALFWRRSLMNKVGLLDTDMRFSMDFDFILRLLLNGNAGRTKNYLGMFRLHQEAKTARLLEICVQENRVIKTRYESRFTPLVGHSGLNRKLLRIKRWLTLLADAPYSYLAFKIGRRLHLNVPISWINSTTKVPLAREEKEK